MTRRHWLRRAGVLALPLPFTTATVAEGEGSDARGGTEGSTAGGDTAATGWVRPRHVLPHTQVTTAEGLALPLVQLVQGQVTAVQLMFTGCSSTCPPQGLLFALLSDAVSALPVRLLSLSIDTLGDTPERLRAWQQRFGGQARPAWQLALPRAGEIDTLTATLRGKAAQPGTHTSQVFVLDAQGRLAWRSGDLPPVALVADLMRTLSRQT